MIHPDLVDFLLDRQGQKIAVRIDPTSKVWASPKNKPYMWPSKEAIITASVGKQKHTKKVVEHNSKFDLPSSKWRMAFFIKGGWLLLSTCQEAMMEEEDYADPFDDPENSQFTGDLMTGYYPTWLQGGNEYAWELKSNMFMNKGYYNLDWFMTDVLQHTLWNSMKNGNTKLFKWSPGKKQYQQMISQSRVNAFLDYIGEAGSIQAKSFFWQGSTYLAEKPASNVVIAWDEVYDLYGEDLAVNISDVAAMMVAYGFWLQIPNTKNYMPFMVFKDEYPFLDYKMQNNNDWITAGKPTNKLEKQGWHVYEVPDISERGDDTTFLEAFDNFIEELMGVS